MYDYVKIKALDRDFFSRLESVRRVRMLSDGRSAVHILTTHVTYICVMEVFTDRIKRIVGGGCFTE